MRHREFHPVASPRCIHWQTSDATLDGSLGAERIHGESSQARGWHVTVGGSTVEDSSSDIVIIDPVGDSEHDLSNSGLGNDGGD